MSRSLLDLERELRLEFGDLGVDVHAGKLQRVFISTLEPTESRGSCRIGALSPSNKF